MLVHLRNRQDVWLAVFPNFAYSQPNTQEQKDTDVQAWSKPDNEILDVFVKLVNQSNVDYMTLYITSHVLFHIFIPSHQNLVNRRSDINLSL